MFRFVSLRSCFVSIREGEGQGSFCDPQPATRLIVFQTVSQDRQCIHEKGLPGSISKFPWLARLVKPSSSLPT